jgi:hypothetical protein
MRTLIIIIATNPSVVQSNLVWKIVFSQYKAKDICINSTKDATHDFLGVYRLT